VHNAFRPSASGRNAIDVKRRILLSVILFTGEPNETRRSDAVKMLLILGFLLGLANCYTYGVVQILHAISTLAACAKYVVPFGVYNLAYFVA
jgi:hypothetical protein